MHKESRVFSFEELKTLYSDSQLEAIFKHYMPHVRFVDMTPKTNIMVEVTFNEGKECRILSFEELKKLYSDSQLEAIFKHYMPDVRLVDVTPDTNIMVEITFKEEKVQ